MNDYKILPNDLQAEQSVLGCCLVDKDSVNNSIELLVAEDFYKPAHQIIFKCILSLFSKDEAVDIITLKNELEAINKFKDVGGFEYIVTLPDKAPLITNIRNYINIVKEKATKRNLIKMSNEIATSSFDNTISANELTELAEKKIFELTQKKNTLGASKLKDLIITSISNLEEVYNNGNKKGIPTGFVDVDRRMGGLKGSELIILAARPRNG